MAAKSTRPFSANPPDLARSIRGMALSSRSVVATLGGVPVGTLIAPAGPTATFEERPRARRADNDPNPNRRPRRVLAGRVRVDSPAERGRPVRRSLRDQRAGDGVDRPRD